MTNLENIDFFLLSTDIDVINNFIGGKEPTIKFNSDTYKGKISENTIEFFSRLANAIRKLDKCNDCKRKCIFRKK